MKKEKFEYKYSAPTMEERREIDSIRSQYLPKDKSLTKMDQLRQLDRKVKNTPIIFALTLTLRTKFMFGLYWISIILFLIVDLVSIIHWDVDGLKSEKKETDKMIRGFRDATAITIILSGLGFLAVIFLREINENITQNIYVIIALFCLLAITQLFNRLMIHSNIKHTSKFAKEFYKNNNKEK